MFKELDIVVLDHDIKRYGLKEGAIGTIVDIYKGDKKAEVEFIDSDGKTIAVIPLDFSEVRSAVANIKTVSEQEDIIKSFNSNYGLLDYTFDRIRTYSEGSGVYTS